MTRAMKAARIHAYGGPEVVRYEQVPVPEPEDVNRAFELSETVT